MVAVTLRYSKQFIIYLAEHVKPSHIFSEASIYRTILCHLTLADKLMLLCQSYHTKSLENTRFEQQLNVYLATQSGLPPSCSSSGWWHRICAMSSVSEAVDKPFPRRSS